MQTIGLLGMLGICSREDLRYRQISVCQVGLFGILGIMINVILKNNVWNYILAGVSIGLVMYVISVVSDEKIGKGDALVVFVIGIYLGLFQTLKLLWISSLIAAIAGIFLLLIKKKKPSYEVPFVPFLMAGYLIILIQQNIWGVAA